MALARAGGDDIGMFTLGDTALPNVQGAAEGRKALAAMAVAVEAYRCRIS